MRRILPGLLLHFLTTLPFVDASHKKYDLTYLSPPNNSETIWAKRDQLRGKASTSGAVCEDGLCCSKHVRTWN